MLSRPEQTILRRYFILLHNPIQIYNFMEIALLSIIVLLTLLNIVFMLITRNKKTSEPEINSKIELLSGNLSRLESNLKEDFRLNREENASLNRDNRAELGNSLKEFTL